MMYTQCIKCNRPLKNPVSMKIGMGAVCRQNGKHKTDNLNEDGFKKIIQKFHGELEIEGDWNTKIVMINGNRLHEGYSQSIKNHSPDGFNWGYGGSGPAQLALALLLTATDETTARMLYQNFKWLIVATLPQANFKIKLNIQNWIKKEEALQ